MVCFALCLVLIQLRKVYRKDSWVLKQSLSYCPLKRAHGRRTGQPKHPFVLMITLENLDLRRHSILKGPMKASDKLSNPWSHVDFIWHISPGGRLWLCVAIGRCRFAFSAWSRFILHLVSRLCFRFQCVDRSPQKQSHRVRVNPVSARPWDWKALGTALHVHMVLEPE